MKITAQDLNFENGIAVLKQGRKVVAKIIDLAARKEAWEAEHGKPFYMAVSKQYPFNLEMFGGIAQCTDLEDVLFLLNHKLS